MWIVQRSAAAAVHLHHDGRADRADGHLLHREHARPTSSRTSSIPIAAVIWRYNGMLPEEIANRIVLFSERIAQTVVNDVEHTESQSVNGTAVVKYFFQPNADQDLSFAQITARLADAAGSCRRPARRRRSCSPTTPRACRSCSSRCPATALPESQIFDSRQQPLRTQLATVPGAPCPTPSAASSARCRSISIPSALRAHGLSADDVVTRHRTHRTSSCPPAPRKSARSEYYVKLNASPTRIDQLNDLPIRANHGDA